LFDNTSVYNSRQATIIKNTIVSANTLKVRGYMFRPHCSHLQATNAHFAYVLEQLLFVFDLYNKTVCRLRADCSPLSTGILYGCLQRVTIPDAVIIQFDLLKMSTVLLETCRGL